MGKNASTRTVLSVENINNHCVWCKASDSRLSCYIRDFLVWVLEI